MHVGIFDFFSNFSLTNPNTSFFYKTSLYSKFSLGFFLHSVPTLNYMGSNGRHHPYMGRIAYRQRLLRPIYGSCRSQRVNMFLAEFEQCYNIQNQCYKMKISFHLNIKVLHPISCNI